MKRIVISLFMASLVLVLLAGCGGGAKETPAAAQPTQAPAAAQQPTAQQPAAQPTAKPAEPAAPTQAPAPTATVEEEAALTVEDRQSGLEQLNSYRAHWEGSWKAADNDETTNMMWKWYQEYTADPEAIHMRLEGVNLVDEQKEFTTEIWRIGNTTYIMAPVENETPQCISISSEEQDRISEDMFNPGNLGRVEGARYVGTETVNGIRAKHYKYDEKAATFLGAAKAAGDLWVAVDGDYVIKETVTWEGSAGMFGVSAEAKGEGTWTWEILEVNPRLTINPPENCESAAGDLPILPNATDKAQFGDMVSYKTATPLRDVAQFYQNELPGAGWQAEGEAQITDQFGMLGFTKDGQNLQIMLSPEGDKTSVMIIIQKK